MNEEIVLEDTEEKSGPESPTNRVMPMIYIQQSTPMTSNQTIVSQSTTKLAATIINPNNQIQNKVFINIQGANQVGQSKPQIVFHRPINTVSTANVSGAQGQKHIVFRKSNTSAAQIVPLNAAPQNNQANAQAGKHTFAYLGTLIKPNKSRESVVIPAGTLPTPQISKPKLVITPVISQLTQTSTSPSSGPPSQSPKHMANLILPVGIPQQSSSAKQSMFNLKINNGPMPNDNGKPAISVLRESKTTNSTANPPPLHPITKMSLLSGSKGNSNSSDGIKITENPDSAVIMPIPKKDEYTPPERKRKMLTNILRPGEKRPKKQSRKSPHETLLDLNFPSSSPESEQDKDKRAQNDDVITLIKVIPGEDKATKLKAPLNASDDEIKIELVKTANNVMEATLEPKKEPVANHCEDANATSQSDSNFDAAKALDWKDGVGLLPGSTLKFRMNEFGMMDLVEEDENKQDKDSGIGDKENVCLLQNASKASPATSSCSEKKADEKKIRSAETFYCCNGCGCHGLASEFESPISCSPTCTEVIEAQKQLQIRREKDLKELRAKRKRKKIASLMQDHHATFKEEKSERFEDKHESKSPKFKSETDEDTKDTLTGDIDIESSVEPFPSKYPWLKGKSGFSWSKYLEYTKAKAAPVKLFKDPFPYNKNLFRVGMKLEGIDPEHPSRFCVLTVIEVVGFRIRLHFDGFPENYDFWVRADSMDIFPVGWAEKNGHKLNPPKGYVASNFNWNAYLKTCKATSAPKTIFYNKNNVFPTSFRVGMKLEAVDRKHSSAICVASVAGLLDTRILVHFDSWNEVYDYWADTSSPYIHPVGWCHHNGHTLTPPNNYKDRKSFTWDSYLRETRALAAPARAFKQRALCGFKQGMKLEVVDKRVPQLIRVATVEDVKDHMLKIHFDGWPENHAYWVDDDSLQIHPVGWCVKTGHPLEPPLTREDYAERPECGTHGCRGIGHIKGPKFATHNSASGCPYSPQNYLKARISSDRLKEKFENEQDEDFKIDKTDKIKDKPEKLERYSSFEKTLKLEKRIKQEDEDSSDKNERMDFSTRPVKTRYSDEDEENPKKRKKRQRQKSEEPLSQVNSFGDSTSASMSYISNISDKQLRTELYHSVYNPGYNPLPDTPQVWAKHSSALNRVVAKQNTNPRRWSNEEVIKFIQSVPNCKEIGSIFRKHSIDGEAFLMLTQEDLVSLLGLRLGPAIKLYNSIVLLRRRAT